MVAVEFGKYVLTLRLGEFPEGLGLDTRKRMMTKDDLQGLA